MRTRSSTADPTILLRGMLYGMLYGMLTGGAFLRPPHRALSHPRAQSDVRSLRGADMLRQKTRARYRLAVTKPPALRPGQRLTGSPRSETQRPRSPRPRGRVHLAPLGQDTVFFNTSAEYHPAPHAACAMVMNGKADTGGR